MDVNRMNKVMNDAAKYAGIETLETRGRDSLDIHAVGVSAMRRMFEYMYRSGYAAGTADARGQDV